MAIKAGQILHVGNDSVVIDRIQTAGPGNLNIPTEKIYELGNYKSVATIRDVPDLAFTLESLDVSTEIEQMLLQAADAATSYDMGTSKSLDIASQFKAGKDAAAAFDVVGSVGLPYLKVESISYRFGLRDNARQTIGLRGDSIFYNPGATYVDKAAGSGAAGQVVTSSQPAYLYDGDGTSRRALSVVAGNKRLIPGVDYTEANVAAPTGVVYPTDSSVFSVTLTNSVPATEEIRLMYASPTVRTYPDTVHQGTGVKPAAVRGKDIDVYLGGVAAANKLTSVQGVGVDWRATLEKDEEFGNYFAVANDFDVPVVTGSLDFKPRDPQEFLAKLRKLTGVTSATRVVGANSSVALPLDIVIKNAANANAVLKRIHVPDARFTVPGFSGRVQQKLTITANFESDEGGLTVFES